MYINMIFSHHPGK